MKIRSTHEELKKKALSDPEVKAEYDAIGRDMPLPTDAYTSCVLDGLSPGLVSDAADRKILFNLIVVGTLATLAICVGAYIPVLVLL